MMVLLYGLIPPSYRGITPFVHDFDPFVQHFDLFVQRITPFVQKGERSKVKSKFVIYLFIFYYLLVVGIRPVGDAYMRPEPIVEIPSPGGVAGGRGGSSVNTENPGLKMSAL